MDRALLYLLGVRLKNRILVVLRRPTRLVGLVLLLGLLALTVWGGGAARGPDAGANAQTVLVAVLALYVLLAILGGIGEPGLGFLPADLDYVLPGPFRRAQILAYHLAKPYGQILVLALLYVVFLGAVRLPHPALAWLATTLCLGVAAHLQVAATLVASRVGEHAYGRLRRTSRLLLIALLLVAALLAIGGVAGAGDVGGGLRALLATPAAQVVLYPAVTAGRAAAAPSLAAALPALLGLLACGVASFVLVLLFPVDVVEETYGTAAWRRQQVASSPVRSRAFLRLPGAAAVAWLNTLLLRRRPRMVVGLLAMLLVVLLASGVRAGASPGGVLGVLAFFPLLAHLPLGFRGQRDHLETLKTLPLGPVRLALAQIVIPAGVIYLTQAVVLVAFLAMERLAPGLVGGALAALPVLDVGVVALVETFSLGHDPRHVGFFWTTLQMLAIVVSIAPTALAAVLLLHLGAPVPLALGFALALHVGVVLVLVRVLAWRFARWEPGQDSL